MKEVALSDTILQNRKVFKNLSLLLLNKVNYNDFYLKIEFFRTTHNFLIQVYAINLKQWKPRKDVISYQHVTYIYILLPPKPWKEKQKRLLSSDKSNANKLTKIEER